MKRLNRGSCYRTVKIHMQVVDSTVCTAYNKTNAISGRKEPHRAMHFDGDNCITGRTRHTRISEKEKSTGHAFLCIFQTDAGEEK